MLRESDVVGTKSWQAWARQELGVPTVKRRGPTAAGVFISEHGIDALMRLTEYCKENAIGRRIAHVDSVPLYYDKAVAAGWFRTDDDLRTKIDSAIYEELDPEWVRRLMSSGGDARSVYQEWLEHEV